MILEASLVECDADVERAAVSEADAITPLALLFAGSPPSTSGNKYNPILRQPEPRQERIYFLFIDRAAEGALRAFAAMSAQAEDSRKAIASHSCVIAYLSNACGGAPGVAPAVRVAALSCVHALSRSQK